MFPNVRQDKHNGDEMKTPTAPGSGRQGSANSKSANSSITAPPPRQQSIVPPAGSDGQELIAVVAELFPAVFVADRWKPHKPIKIGIHQDLIDSGVLQPDECRILLRRYCSRLMYQRAVAAGGLRYGLDGEPAGEVTAEQIAGGKSVVAAIEAKRAARAKAIADERKAARKAAGKVAKTASVPVLTKAEPTAKTPGPPNGPSRKVQTATVAPSVKAARLGLIELKAAALARRSVGSGG
jgi:ProP effector